MFEYFNNQAYNHMFEKAHIPPMFVWNLARFYNGLETIYNLWMRRRASVAGSRLTEFKRRIEMDILEPFIRLDNLTVKDIYSLTFFIWNFDAEMLEHILRIPPTSQNFGPDERNKYLQLRSDTIKEYFNFKQCYQDKFHPDKLDPNGLEVARSQYAQFLH